MTIAKSSESTFTTLPDHTQLPQSDGTFVKNFQEHPQSILLTDSISPKLQQLHPDGQYAIGQDCGIYWRMTDPPERGAEAPDWFYVPNVPPLIKGEVRRSYVLWQEYIAPLIVLEFVSGDGSEERDTAPPPRNNQEEIKKVGKFWVYEQAIRVPFYGIYEVKKASVEVYHLVDGRYARISANDRGHFPIPLIGVELGIWEGLYQNLELPWLRWWDSDGNLLLTSDERSQILESQLQQERQRAERLAERLRQMGIDPDQV
ncbi:MAG TPA: Uma2 family endonuclease [Cyanophyceae cyanobacterium]